MEKYFTALVDEGYDILHPAMVDFLVREMKKRYGSQICSRLVGELEVLPFLGTDIRKLRKDAT